MIKSIAHTLVVVMTRATISAGDMSCGAAGGVNHDELASSTLNKSKIELRMSVPHPICELSPPKQLQAK